MRTRHIITVSNRWIRRSEPPPVHLAGASADAFTEYSLLRA